jgi:glycine/D-amino acid oxidase-like deaminating enzyme
MQQAMFDTVDEVGRVVEAERIDARFHKGGALTAAHSAVQLARTREEVDWERAWGFGEEHVRLLDAEEARARVGSSGCLGALYTPDCAAVDPARLARGLAQVVERMGVPIYERTPVLSSAPRRLETRVGSVKAEVVVRATEGYTATLSGHKRVLIPFYSLMIATQPLGKEVWNQIGWSGRELFNDGRFLIIYAMRTEDDRIAIGGRGAPYHFGSGIADAYDREPSVFAALEYVVRCLFPEIGEFQVTHKWGGPIGIPRDWYSSVGLERASGLAWAGGYVGDGVATANLAGRTLRDLVLGHRTELTKLPWVNHRSRQWEPEPLRWLGINGALWAMGSADRYEASTGRPSKRATIVKRLIGG